MYIVVINGNTEIKLDFHDIQYFKSSTESIIVPDASNDDVCEILVSKYTSVLMSEVRIRFNEINKIDSIVLKREDESDVDILSLLKIAISVMKEDTDYINKFNHTYNREIYSEYKKRFYICIDIGTFDPSVIQLRLVDNRKNVGMR